MHLRPVRRPLVWLDAEHRRLVAPLALWDVTEQLEQAASLYGKAARR